MVNLKNLLASIVSVSVLAAAIVVVPAKAQTLVDAEFDAALSWAYDTGLTRYNTTEAFQPYNLITREQGAKFFSAMAVQSLCLDPMTDISADYSDVSATQSDPTLVSSVKLATQLGLVKGSNGMFFPLNNMTKAESIAVLVRALNVANGEEALLDESGTPWFSAYYSAAATAGITNDSIDNIDRPVTRYEVLLMLYRAALSVEDTVTCDGDVDLTDLLNDLFGEDDADDMEDMDDDDDMDDEDDMDDVVTVSDGMVMASLSPSTPNGDTVPGLATIEVAAFDFTASDDDVELETVVLERFGIGSDDVIEDVTLLVNGGVVSRSRSFNSDDEVTLTLNPDVTIEAGETVTVTVLAEIGCADNSAGEGCESGATEVSNEEFSIGLTDFETNGDEDTSNLPIIANEFEVGGTNAARITVEEDGNLSDVELGEEGAEIASFSIDNESDETVFITSITLEDDENEIEDSAENFVLEFDGQEVAMVASVNDKYLTFNLSTPVEIDENEEEDFKVLADIIGGAGEQINLIIDEPIYVRGYDDRFGFGLAVTAEYGSTDENASTRIDINAGELTFVELDIEADELRQDREEFVIAAFDVNINAGQDLTLEDIEFDVVSTNGSSTSGYTSTTTFLSQFDEVELQVVRDGTVRTYDLDTASTLNNTAFTAGERDLGVTLPEGSDITIQLVVDTRSTFSDGVVGDSFVVSLDVANDVEIIENDDDEEVTDIVPSSMQFDRIDLVSSNVDVNSINLTDVDVVKGADNVDVLKFEIEADDVSSVLFEGITLRGSTTTDTGSSIRGGVFATNGTAIDQNTVTAVRLWMLTDAGYVELEAEGGFDFNGGVITLDDFDEVEIARGEDMEFLVTVDIADSDTIAGSSLAFAATMFDIEDDDNVQLEVSDLPKTSTRTVTITTAGELTVEVETDEDEVNDEVFVLGGSDRNEAPYVAAFEFTAENESVEIEDLTITANGDAGDLANFDQAVTELVLYDEDGNVIDSEVVNSTTVEFENIDLVIEEGSQFVFVKAITDIIGDNENGDTVNDITLSLTVSEVDGVDSGDDAVVMYENGAGTTTDQSLAFSVVPVKFSNAEFVTSAAGSSVDTSTTNGNDVNLAILKLTADSWDNTNRNDGSDLEANVEILRFETNNADDVSGYEIRRIGNGSTNFIAGTVLAGSGIVEFNLGTGANTVEFESGEEGYYLIRADIDAGTDTNTTVRLTLDNLNGGATVGEEAIVYSPSDVAIATTADDYTELRIEEEFIESQNVTVNNS